MWMKRQRNLTGRDKRLCFCVYFYPQAHTVFACLWLGRNNLFAGTYVLCVFVCALFSGGDNALKQTCRSVRVCLIQCGCADVCVCACKWECVCVNDGTWDCGFGYLRERESVYVCVCERACMWVTEGGRVCVCIHVSLTRVRIFVCMSECVCTCL